MPRLRQIKKRFKSFGYAKRVFFGTTTYYNDHSGEEDTYPIEYHYCLDEVNKRDTDNDLNIQHVGRLFTPINGRFEISPDTYWEAVDYIPPSMLLSASHAAGIESMIPSIGEVATTTLARSNPSRPDVSLPNFIYELKDLPGMIRDIGRLKLLPKAIRALGPRSTTTNGLRTSKEAANWFLSYQMGWRPLIGDLRKLLSFQSQVDKKIRELHGLYNNGGLQRRVRLPEWMADKEELVNPALAIDSFMMPYTHRVTTMSHIERWGTVRWQPANLPDHRYSSKELAALARRLVFGINGITAKQVWDAIPWTWLVGWFTNCDEFLQAHSNSIPLVHSTPCVMTKIDSRTSWVRNEPDESVWRGGYGDMGYSTKHRTTSPGSLSARIPFLNPRQLSILGALAIQRRR